MENRSGGASHQNTTETTLKPPPIIWTSGDGGTVLRSTKPAPGTEWVPVPKSVLTPNQIHAVKTAAVWSGFGVVGIGTVIVVGVVVSAVWQTLVVGVCAIAIPTLSVTAWRQHRHRTRFRDSVRQHDSGHASAFKSASTTTSGKTVNININIH